MPPLRTSSYSSLTLPAGGLDAVRRSFYPTSHKCEALEVSLQMMVCLLARSGQVLLGYRMQANICNNSDRMTSKVLDDVAEYLSTPAFDMECGLEVGCSPLEYWMWTWPTISEPI